MAPIYKVRIPPRRDTKPQANIDLSGVLSLLQETQSFKNKIEQEVRTLVAQTQKELVSMKTNFKKGDRGERGIPGRDGKNGSDGRDGYDGVHGKDGKNGKDAKQVDIEKVAALAATKVKIQKIDVEAITKRIIDELTKKYAKQFENIDATIRNLSSKTMLGGGGGGMGSIKYFKFACDDSATEFTLPDIPTQEGAAVFAFYQGSRLHPDDHYTVSGKKLTTSFVGEQGSFLDGWIIT